MTTSRIIAMFKPCRKEADAQPAPNGKSAVRSKVTLLTEQTTVKLIELLDELRRDLSNVRNHHDSEATELQKPMNPELVLATLGERLRPQTGSSPDGPAPD